MILQVRNATELVNNCLGEFGLSSFGYNWQITTQRNHCKNIWTPKETQSYEVIAPSLVGNLANQVKIEVLHIRGKDLPDDQHSIAGLLGHHWSFSVD